MNNPQPYIPQNQFEKLFEEAVKDPKERPNFIRELLRLELLVFGSIEKNPDGSETASFSSMVLPDGSKIAFGFTSVEALQFTMARESLPVQDYVCLRASELFKLLAGNTGLILNGGSNMKHFSPSELSEILTASPPLKTGALSVNSAVSIGQPVQVPTGLISALKAYLIQTSKLKDIYLGEHSGNGTPSVFLTVLELENPHSGQEIEPIVQGLMQSVQGCLAGLPMDITVADEKLRDLFKKGALLSVRNSET